MAYAAVPGCCTDLASDACPRLFRRHGDCLKARILAPPRSVIVQLFLVCVFYFIVFLSRLLARSHGIWRDPFSDVYRFAIAMTLTLTRAPNTGRPNSTGNNLLRRTEHTAIW